MRTELDRRGALRAMGATAALEPAVPFPPLPEFHEGGELVTRRAQQAITGELAVRPALEAAAGETADLLRNRGYAI